MSFLGVVILTFGFKIYSQRDLMTRHAPEIFGATLLSSLFSLFGTAAAGKALGLAPELARAIVPRSVTVALAMPIAQQLQVADVSITAVVVLLTGASLHDSNVLYKGARFITASSVFVHRAAGRCNGAVAAGPVQVQGPDRPRPCHCR